MCTLSWSSVLARSHEQPFSVMELPMTLRITLQKQCPWLSLAQLEAYYRPADPNLVNYSTHDLKFEKQYNYVPHLGLYQWQWQHVQDFQKGTNNPIFILRPCNNTVTV